MLEVEKSLNACFNNPNYRLLKIYLSMVGFWPTQDRKIQFIIRLFQFTGIFSATVLEVKYFIDVFGDIKKILDCTPVLFIVYVYYVFVFNAIWHFYLMKRILNQMIKNWKNIMDINEHAILQKHARKGHILTKLYAGAMVATLILFSCSPIIQTLLQLNTNNESDPINLLEANYFVDPVKYYIPIYLHEFQATGFVILFYLTWDTYYVTVVQHSCSMFEILGYRLNKIGEDHIKLFNELYGHKQDKFACTQIKKCICYHSECIKLAEYIEKYFQISWLLQVFVNMLILSVCGSRIINYSDEIESIFKFGLIAITCCFRLFYVCWTGEKLFYHSGKVHRYICRMPWHQFSSNARKLLILLLVRSSKPCIITMGTMLTLNFESYRMLIQMSISYFTMIISTQSK